MLIHLDGIERQLDALDAQLEQIAAAERWAGQVQVLTLEPVRAAKRSVGVEVGECRGHGITGVLTSPSSCCCGHHYRAMHRATNVVRDLGGRR
jgi:hypothetical protein